MLQCDAQPAYQVYGATKVNLHFFCFSFEIGCDFAVGVVGRPADHGWRRSRQDHDLLESY